MQIQYIGKSLGNTMSESKIKYYVDDNENYIDDFILNIKRLCRERQWVLGDQVREFEKICKDVIGSTECIGVNSGTDALRICCEIVRNERKGDQILLPGNAYYASALAIIQAGLSVKFIDVDKCGRITYEEILKNIEPRTAGIMLVHLYGRTTITDETLKRLIQKHPEIRIIEDCAQSFGKYRHRQTGGIDLAAFSFYPTKNLGALGDGGLISVKSKKDAEFARGYRNYSKINSYEFSGLGLNSRLDSIQASFLLTKHRNFHEDTIWRIKIAEYYHNHLNNGLTFNDIIEYRMHIVPIFVKNVIEVTTNLIENNIEYSRHYPVIPQDQPLFEKLKFVNLTYSRMLSEHQISLPFHSYLSHNEVEKITRVVNKYALPIL